MTNEQLDRLAAEKVMGWKWRSGSVTWWQDSDGKYAGTHFTPTTNEQHAAMVRDRMLVDGFYASMTVGVLSFWQVEFWKYRALLVIAEGKANRGSLTYATTAAALLAVGAITEEELND